MQIVVTVSISERSGGGLSLETTPSASTVANGMQSISGGVAVPEPSSSCDVERTVSTEKSLKLAFGCISGEESDESMTITSSSLSSLSLLPSANDAGELTGEDESTWMHGGGSFGVV